MRVNRHVLKLFRWARTLIAHFIIEIKAYHCFSMSWSWAMLRFVEYTFWQVKVVCIVSEVFTSIPKIYSFSKIMANSNAIDFSNDILQPLEEADLLRYRDTCAKHLPSALNAHHFVTLQNRWKQILSQPENVALSENISSKWVCKFYVSHNRNIENCTFIEISGESSTNSGDAWNIIFPFTHEWPPTDLRDSARIDCRMGPMIEIFSEDLWPIVDILLVQKKISDWIDWNVTLQSVALSKEDALAFDVEYEDLDSGDIFHQLISIIFNTAFPMTCTSINSVNIMRLR